MISSLDISTSALVVQRTRLNMISGNLDLTTPMVDAMESTRACEGDIGAMEISKEMSRQRLAILA